MHKIATVVPEKYYTQEFALEKWLSLIGDTEEKRLILKKIYKATGIEKRHTIIDDYDKDPSDYTFYPKNPTMKPEPSTAKRNDLFITEAKRLSLKAVKKLLSDIPEFDKQKITHLITVSCTGFLAPGIDFYIVKDFDLNPGVHRFNLGFMGCQAAYPALKLARNICLSEPDARVLIVNVELCSVHIQQDFVLDLVVSNVIFADGISAALVSANKEDVKGSKLILHEFISSFAEESEEAMAWSIGDTGFLMKLSVYIPNIVQDNIRPVMEGLFRKSGVTKEEIDIWAIHPGGKAILTKVQQALAITREDLDHCYHVMQEYGNMSSSTIMFVFERILNDLNKKGIVFSAAFGPGVTIESGLLEKIDG